MRDSKSTTDLRRYPLSRRRAESPSRADLRPRAHNVSRQPRRPASNRTRPAARVSPRAAADRRRESRADVPSDPAFEAVRSARARAQRPCKMEDDLPPPRRRGDLRQPHAVKESERDWHDRTVLMAERSASPIANARPPLARRTTKSLKPWTRARRPASHIRPVIAPPRASSPSLPSPRVSQSARRTSGSTAIAPVFPAVR